MYERILVALDGSPPAEQILPLMLAEGLTVDVEHPPGPADGVIIETAQRLGADLIALTTHGRGGLEKLVFGSVAERAWYACRRVPFCSFARPETRLPGS